MWEEVLLFVVPFRSQIFEAFFDVFLDLVILPYFNFYRFLSSKVFNQHLFCAKFPCVQVGKCLCMYMYGNISQAFAAEPLDGFWWNLVWMKNSRSLTCFKACWLDPPRGGSSAGQNKKGYWGLLKKNLLTSCSDRMATATNRMHSNDIEACGKKCCNIWLHWVYLWKSANY